MDSGVSSSTHWGGLLNIVAGSIADWLLDERVAIGTERLNTAKLAREARCTYYVVWTMDTDRPAISRSVFQGFACWPVAHYHSMIVLTSSIHYSIVHSP